VIIDYGNGLILDTDNHVHSTTTLELIALYVAQGMTPAEALARVKRERACCL
jgi:hypothetical protein